MKRSGRAVPYIIRIYHPAKPVEVEHFRSGTKAKEFLRNNGCCFGDAYFCRISSGDMLQLTSGDYLYEVEEDVYPSACIKARTEPCR